MIDLEKKTTREKLVEWYETLDPSKRKKVTLIGGGIVLFIGSAILIVATSEEGSDNFIRKPRKVEYTLFSGKSPRDVSVDAMAGKIKKLSEDFIDIKATFQRQDQKIQAASRMIKEQTDELNRRTEKLAKQTSELYDKLAEANESLKAQIPLPEVPLKNDQQTENKVGNNQTPVLVGQQPPHIGENDTAPTESGPKIRIVTGSGEDSKDNKSSTHRKLEKHKIAEHINIKKASAKNKSPDMYLPAGSILSGTLITGLDAPTSNQSRSDPFPSLLRVKHEAILPNRHRMDIRECFLIASGYGDLSAERAYMRAERISCIKKDGGVIETSMDAYSVGEDGKAGVRGRVVSKNGQIIGNALLSGFVSGISQAFSPQRVQPFNTVLQPGEEQVFQYPSPEFIAGQAFTGGMKGAAEQIANYYLEMAKNIFPVIEIDAGRKIDFIMIRGASLNAKSKSTRDNVNLNGGYRSLNNVYSGNQNNVSGSLTNRSNSVGNMNSTNYGGQTSGNRGLGIYGR